MLIPRRRSETGLHREVWQAYNELLDYCRAITPTSGLQHRIVKTNYGSRVVLSNEDEESVPQPFLLKSVSVDYVVCRTYLNQTQGLSDIFIALEWDIRRTPFDGQTIPFIAEQPTENLQISYTYLSNTYRTATLKDSAGATRSTENQQIIPLLIPDRTVLFALPYVNDDIDLVSPHTGSIAHLALAAGRAWTKV